MTDELVETLDRTNALLEQIANPLRPLVALPRCAFIELTNGTTIPITDDECADMRATIECQEATPTAWAYRQSGEAIRFGAIARIVPSAARPA